VHVSESRWVVCVCTSVELRKRQVESLMDEGTPTMTSPLQAAQCLQQQTNDVIVGRSPLCYISQPCLLQGRYGCMGCCRCGVSQKAKKPVGERLVVLLLHARLREAWLHPWGGGQRVHNAAVSHICDPRAAVARPCPWACAYQHRCSSLLAV